MRSILFLIPLLVHFVPMEAHCQSREPRLVRLIEDEASKAEPLLFFSDGRVGRLPPGKQNWLKRIRLALLKKRNAIIHLDPGQMVDGLRVEELPPGQTPAELTPELAYSPSVVTATEADSIFRNLNDRSRRRAQCYNRAHVWAYESFKNRGLKSMKVFMFFTLKYIREYRYRWWFHVAPLTEVSDGESIRDTVLDPIFMEGPVGLKEWSDRFIRPKTECPVAAKYSDYEKLQNETYCVFMKVPMFFWQPRDLEALEHGGAPKKGFLQDDVDYAYWQAFY
jgi:hypothetical protein